MDRLVRFESASELAHSRPLREPTRFARNRWKRSFGRSDLAP